MRRAFGELASGWEFRTGASYRVGQLELVRFFTMGLHRVRQLGLVR